MLTPIFTSHWKHIKNIINLYKGEIPLADYLKGYFSLYKNCGSKDRKIITKCCYIYYRLDKILQHKTIEEQIALGDFIIHNEDGTCIKEYFPNLIPFLHLSTEEKIHYLETHFKDINFSNFIPYKNKITPEINLQQYTFSFLQNPTFYIRLIKQQQEIKNILKSNRIDFKEIEENILHFNSFQNIKTLLEPFKACFFYSRLCLSTTKQSYRNKKRYYPLGLL